MPHDYYMETKSFDGDIEAESEEASSAESSSQPPSKTTASTDSGHSASKRAAPSNTGAGARLSFGQGANSATDTGMPKPGDCIDHYEIIRELGRGGMGVVYLARDLKLARRVAIKFIHRRHGEYAKRLMAEAQTTARCQHEHIVVIHDIGQHDGHPYMVLEYLPGRTLRIQCAGGVQLPERALELVIPVVRALERAHAHGIIHRDLKPNNILVDEAGMVKVLDFGIAKVFAANAADHSGPLASLALSADAPPSSQASLAMPSQTRTGAMVGTLPYMSPEQIGNSADVDERTDIWAVGMILYELLLGRHPLDPLSAEQIESMTDLDAAIPSAAERLPHIGTLGPIIDRCLKKRRDERTPTASALLTELEDCIAHRGSKRLVPTRQPFPGLAAFQTADADRFYGRSHDVANLVAHIRNQPLLTMVGQSGAGKSSLVRAGVIPALERAGEGWHTLIIRPGRDPLAALVAVLDELQEQGELVTRTMQLKPEDSVEGESRHQPADSSSPHSTRDARIEHLRREPGWFGSQLRAWARHNRLRLLVFVDQFEEIYTLADAGGDAAACLKCLDGVADDASSPLRVILSIRSDFLDRLMEAGHVMGALSHSLVFINPMTRAGLREALNKPVQAAGYEFEESALIDDMLDELAADGTSGVLPLLQFAASKLWDSRDQERRLLTRAGYEAFGGVAGALAAHGNAVLTRMSPAKLDIVRSIFERLVTPERTRAVVTVAELRQLSGSTAIIDEIISYLAKARLLTIERHLPNQESRAGTESGAKTRHESYGGPAQPGDAGDSTVELIHESLIDGWPLLRSWLEESREDAAILDRLRIAAGQWDAGDRREGLLWRGKAADEVEHWQTRYHNPLPERERAFVDAVLAVKHRGARAKRMAIGAGFAVLLGLLVAADNDDGGNRGNEQTQ